MKKIIKILFVVVCMITIFYFSSDSADLSTKKSDSIIIKTTELFLGHKLSNNEKDKYISKYVKLVRKSAHFTIYLILGISFISLLKEYKIVSNKSIIYTIIFVFIYACSDEVHQLFVSGRSCEILDIIIDTCGGLVGSIIYRFIYKFRRRKS